jgi:hypothetical protein
MPPDASEPAERPARSESVTPESIEPVREIVPRKPGAPQPDLDEIVDIFGTVVLVGPHGSERAREDGQLDLEFVESNADETERVLATRPSVAVVDGVFRARGLRRGSIVVRALAIAGSEAVAGRTIPAELPNCRVLHVFAYLCATTRLQVLDARTRSPLSAVTVLRSRHPHAVVPKASSSTEIVVREATSPVELRTRALERREPFAQDARAGSYLVGAPGYAWTRVEVSFAPGAANVVELERGAELEVIVLGERPEPVVERVPA